MIRLFAALAIPGDIGEALQRLQHGLPGARWRPREGLHLTVRFVGEVAETVADDFDAELGQIRSGPFEMSLAGVGSFGEAGSVSAVWAGARTNESLKALAASCERAARRAGLPRERRAFRPHVTLAYLNRGAPEAAARWLPRHNLFASAPFTIDRFGLYSSSLGRQGSTYRLERSYPLGRLPARASGAGR
ncbi:MAG: RNA 2',3'-cyclic phosphodiesterase [Caulobacteraceae bacterium]